MKPLRVAYVLGLHPAAAAFAHGAPSVEVFTSGVCGCRGGWIAHMRENGFRVTTHDVADVAAERRKLDMPDRLGSCHSAEVGGYLIEGHVLAADIRRLLTESVNAIRLAVPGIVPGVPGMTGPKTAYETLLVSRSGTTRVFASH